MNKLRFLFRSNFRWKLTSKQSEMPASPLFVQHSASPSAGWFSGSINAMIVFSLAFHCELSLRSFQSLIVRSHCKFLLEVLVMFSLPECLGAFKWISEQIALVRLIGAGFIIQLSLVFALKFFIEVLYWIPAFDLQGWLVECRARHSNGRFRSNLAGSKRFVTAGTKKFIEGTKDT